MAIKMMKKIFSLLMIVSVIFSIYPFSSVVSSDFEKYDSVTAYVCADAAVRDSTSSNWRERNFGAADDLTIVQSGNKYMGFVKYELPDQEDDDELLNATVSLYKSSGGENTNYLSPCWDSSWIEGTGVAAETDTTGISFNNKPASDDSMRVSFSVPKDSGFVSVDITDIVKKAYQQGDTYVTLYITGDEATTKYDTKEKGTGANKSYLKVYKKKQDIVTKIEIDGADTVEKPENGAVDYTYSINIFSQYNEKMTGVTPTVSFSGTEGVAFSESTGILTVTNVAVPATVQTITVACNGIIKTKNITLRAKLTALKIAVPSGISVPARGTMNYIIRVADQDGLSVSEVFWELDTAAGIEIDQNGKLTVTQDCTPGEYTLRVSSLSNPDIIAETVLSIVRSFGSSNVTKPNFIPALDLVTEAGKYENALDLLESLKILIGDGNGLKEGELLTRADFCLIISRLLGSENTINSTNVFSDVSDKHYAKNAIAMLNDYGMIDGTGNNKFEPELSVTGEQVLKILICMLGYQVAAEAKGGYPAGYITEARSAGILKGSEINPAMPILRGEMAQLVYNSLEIPFMERQYGGEGKYYKSDDYNILSILKVEKIRGKVTAAGGAGITEQSVGADYIRIDDKTYKNLSSASIKHLACMVYAYLKTEDETVVHTVRTGIYEDVYISSDDIEIINGFGTDSAEALIRDDNKKDNRKNLLLSKNAILLVNDIFIKNPVKDDFIPVTGWILFVDTDGDGKYDILKVTSFETMVIGSVNMASKRISAREGGAALDFSDAKKVEIYKNALPAGIADIASGDVLSYYIREVAGEQIVFMCACDYRVSGAVSEYSDTLEYQDVITVNGENYRLHRSLVKGFKPGDEVVLYFDVTGIVFDLQISQKGISFCYAIKGSPAGGGEFKDRPRIKVFAEDGKFYSYPLEYNVNVNSVKYSAHDAYRLMCQEESFVPQLIIYNLNADNSINTIKLAENNALTAGYSGYDENNEFTKDFSAVGVTYYSGIPLATKYKIGNRTRVFGIPDDLDSEIDFKVGGEGVFKHNTSLSFDIYNSDMNFVPEAVVLLGKISESEEFYKNSIIVIDRVVTVVDEDGELINAIYGIWDNLPSRRIGIISKKDLVSFDTTNRWGHQGVAPKELVRGDVIQADVDEHGEIINFKVLHKMSDMDYVEKWNTSSIIKEYNMHSDIFTAYCQFNRWIDNSTMYIKVSSQEPSRTRLTVLSSKIKYYVCSNNIVRIGDRSDIEEGNSLFIRAFRSAVTDIVIYK